MESYISHPDFGKGNFELFKTIKQETNNFQIDELLYLKKDFLKVAMVETMVSKLSGQ